MKKLLVTAVSFLLSSVAFSLPNPGMAVYVMPINCAELLPDSAQFTDFFGATARGLAGTDRPLSRRLFRILAMRDRLADRVDLNRAQNPIDILIQKTICFFRKDIEPLRAVPFDDDEYLKYLRKSVRDLEQKVDELVYDAEFERFQREEYERKVSQNRSAVDKLQREADQEAQISFDKISRAAKKRAKVP